MNAISERATAAPRLTGSHPTPTAERVIVVFATAWGPIHGGINSFNHSLCSSLPRILAKHRVLCVTISASVSAKTEAAALGVTLVSLDRDATQTFDPLWSDAIARHLISIVPLSTIDWWIGHDVTSGGIALAMAHSTHAGHVALIMHMSYADYQYAKHPASEGPAKAIQQQRSLLSQADMALAIGPLLHERLGEIRSKDPCERLIPGLPDQAKDLPRSRLSAITFGRFEPTEALIKQAPLAVAGFASAVKEGRRLRSKPFEDAALHVVGVPPEDVPNLIKIAEQHAGRLLNIGTHGFIDDRAELRFRLEQSNLSMMLSWHEGFGLAAWEAIGTGIPTILSRESGVFRLLNEIGGQATGCVQVLDVRGATGKTSFARSDQQELCQIILSLGMNLEKHLRDADYLSRLLRTQLCYTWSSSATQFATALGLPVIMSTVGSTGLNREILQEQVEIIAPANDVASALRLAEAFIERGQYDNALETVSSIANAAKSSLISTDLELLKAETLLRLNRYAEAELLINSLLDSGGRMDACRELRANSILNTIYRDRGEYDAAVELGLNLVRSAETDCPTQLASAKRKLARALALRGSWQEALKEATESLLLAKATLGGVDQAKAFLAIGEANRHGLNQIDAIPAYAESRKLAAKTGHVDCYLWAVLGLADSLFLVGDVETAEAELGRLATFVATNAQQYHLESLHISLSRVVIQMYRGTSVDMDLDEIVRAYTARGVSWPVSYAESLRSGDYFLPKRF